MKIKSLDAIAAKWASRASGAGQAYSDGIRAPRNSWSAMTAASADNWAQGVQQAVSDKRFEKGVTAAGDSTWANGAINKGAARYGTGVQQAQPRFTAGFNKYAQALQNAQLPPRFPKGDPQNMQRSAFVGNLLRKVKLGQA